MAIVTVSTSNTFNEWRVVTNQLVTEVNKTESGTAALSVDTLTANTVTANGDIAVNGGDLTTTQTTANLFNTTATTLNLGGAATTVEIGAATGTTNVNNNLDVDGDLNVDGGDITVSTSTANLLNTTATTVNFAGAATTLEIGAATGNTNINNNLIVDGNATVSSLTTNNGVVFATNSGKLNTNSNITWNGSVLDVNGNVSARYFDAVNGVNLNYGTANTIPFLDSARALTSNTNLSWNGTTLGVTGNQTVSGTLGVTGNVTLSGELRGPSTFTIDPAVVGDDTGTVVIKGNLQVDGTTTTINSTTLTVDDLNIVLASGAANAAAANGAGITIDGASATITYLSSGDKFKVNKALELDSTLTVAGNTNIDSGTFFVDSSNNRVGVNNSSPVAVFDVTSPSEGSPVLGTSRTRVYEFSGTILENSNYQIFKVTLGDIRINALLRIRLMSTNTAGISRFLGSTMEVVVSRVDGGAFFRVKNQDSGNISLSLPVASGNDVIFGATNSNNGTAQNIGYTCVVELVSSDALSNFTFTDIAAGTAHTGDNSLNTYRQYISDTSILEATTSNVVFNEGGADVDFRVESDNSTHMLFVDAGEDVVKIGSTTAKGTGNRLIVGPGNTTANTIIVVNTEDQNYNGLVISNWDGATTTYGPRIAFDNSGHGGFTIGMGDARNSFDLCSTWGTPLLRLTPSAAIFNEDGADVDFRVESDNQPHMLFVDAGNDVVSIGTSSVLNWYQRALQGPSWAITELLGVDQTAFSTGCYQDAYGYESNWKFAGAYPATLYTQTGDHNFWATSSTRTANGAIVWKQNFTISDTVVVVNDGSNDVDFRVESDNNTAMFFVDASTDRIGIKESTPLSVVDIVVGDRAAGDNGEMFTLKSGTGNAVNKLNMGTSSTNDYAWIQSVRPTSDNKPLLLNPSGGNVLVGTTSSLAKLTVGGSVFPSADNTYDLGSASYSWANVYTGDLHLSNMKKETGNEIDGTKGDWTIQEGENDLFILNNRTGKKYKFKLEEIQ